MSTKITIEHHRPPYPYTGPCPEHGPDCPHKEPDSVDFHLFTECMESDAVYLRIEGDEIRIPVEVWRRITTPEALARVESELAAVAAGDNHE